MAIDIYRNTARNATVVGWTYVHEHVMRDDMTFMMHDTDAGMFSGCDIYTAISTVLSNEGGGMHERDLCGALECVNGEQRDEVHAALYHMVQTGTVVCDESIEDWFHVAR